MAQLPIEMQYSDAHGLTGRVTLHHANITTLADIAARANALNAGIAPISSALFQQVVWSYRQAISGSPAAGFDSNVYRRAFLLFSANGYRGVVSLPSPRAVLFDVAGPYRAIRISRNRLQLLGLLAPLEAAVERLSIPDGRPFPPTFIVGGVGDLAL